MDGPAAPANMAGGTGPILAGYPDRLLGQPGIHRDILDPSLRLIVGKSTASWQVTLRGGERVGLGRYPAVSVSGARDAAERMRRRQESGLDPRNALPAGSQTLGEAITAWQVRRARDGIRSAPERAAAALRHLGSLLSVPVRDIAPDDLDAALADLKHEHPPTARNVVSTLRTIFNDARKRRRFLGENPALDVAKPKVVAGKAFFGFEALRRIWTDSEDLAEADRLYLRFLLLSGCRRGETAALRLGNISFPDRRLVLSERVTKTRSQNWVAIPPLMEDLLRAAIGARSDPRARVFHHDTPFTDARAADVARWVNARTPDLAERKGDPGWVPLHGFRATFLTMGQTVGINGDHINAALSHVSHAGSRSAYDFYGLWPERQRVWAQWCAVLEHLSKNCQKPVSESDLRKLVAAL